MIRVRAAAFDAVAVLLFVAIGRRSHHEDGFWPEATLRVAAPFLIALVLAWLIVRAWRAPQAVGTGVAIWPIVVAAGMLLRHWVFDRGTALAFVIVATVSLGVLLVGWRQSLRIVRLCRAHRGSDSRSPVDREAVPRSARF